MKTVDYYMDLNYSVVVDNFEEDGEKYVRLTIPILPGLEAYGESTEEAFSDLEGAKREWFSQSLDDGLDIAEPGLIGETSGRMTLRMPKSLHKSLTIRAAEEGISLNSYVVNLIQKKETFAETAGKLLSALGKISGSFTNFGTHNLQLDKKVDYVVLGKVVENSQADTSISSVNLIDPQITSLPQKEVFI